MAKLDAAAMAEFEQKHVDPASKGGRNGAGRGRRGAGAACLVLPRCLRPPLAPPSGSAHPPSSARPAPPPLRAGGAHFAFLDGFLKRNSGGSGFVVGSKLSIADIQLFDLMDIFLRDVLFPSQLKQRASAL